jgi:hypothetical protein
MLDTKTPGAISTEPTLAEGRLPRNACDQKKAPEKNVHQLCSD